MLPSETVVLGNKTYNYLDFSLGVWRRYTL